MPLSQFINTSQGLIVYPLGSIWRRAEIRRSSHPFFRTTDRSIFLVERSFLTWKRRRHVQALAHGIEFGLQQ